ncbi:MAG: sodium/proline symporter [bacterium]|nr:sodium/proline symporter [bacterium]
MAEWVWTLIAFALYSVVLIGIVVYRSDRVANMGDYVLGGRKLGSFTIALSAGASNASGWTMLVLPALAFAGGLMHLWTVAGLVVGIWLVWIVTAKRLRRYTIAADDALTIPEFWERRFGDTTGTLRGLTAAISLYFITLYVCSGLIAGAKLLEEVFDLEPTGAAHNMAILIALVALLSYTFMGFVAVSRTDVFQALLMVGGFVIMAVTLMLITANPFQGLENAAPGFWNPFTDAAGDGLGWTPYASALGWGLGTFGALRLLARFMAIKEERMIPRSTYINVGWAVLVFSFGLLMGLVAAPALAARGVDIPDSERLYLVVSSVFFHPVVGGLLLTAVAAAVMSTADSQLLLASAIASRDMPWLKRVTERMRTERQVTVGRLLLVALGLVAAAISILSPESVFALVSLAWGGMGAAFGPVTVMALYWRRFNLAGAFTGVISGTVVSTFWWLMDLGNQGLLDLTASLGLASAVRSLADIGIWEINPAVPGFAAATALAIVVTLATAPPSEEITRLFDQVNSPDRVDPTHAPAP